MINDTELKEYAASITESTVAMIHVTHALREALLNTLEDEESCAIAIQSAKKTRDALIDGTYRIGLMPFMQPATEEEDTDEEEDNQTTAQDTATRGPRAGRGAD